MSTVNVLKNQDLLAIINGRRLVEVLGTLSGAVRTPVAGQNPIESKRILYPVSELRALKATISGTFGAGELYNVVVARTKPTGAGAVLAVFELNATNAGESGEYDLESGFLSDLSVETGDYVFLYAMYTAGGAPGVPSLYATAQFR